MEPSISTEDGGAPLPDPKAWQRRARRQHPHRSPLSTWLTTFLIVLLFAAGLFLRFVAPHAPPALGHVSPTPVVVSSPTAQPGE